MAKTIVRLRPHPHAPRIIDILIPATANTIMGRFQPASLNTSRRCYELHTDQADAFMVFARFNGLHVTNEPRPYQPAKLDGRCPCGEDNCTRNRTVTPEQAEINEWGMFKVNAALARHRSEPITPQQSVALAELDTWEDPIWEWDATLTHIIGRRKDA